MSAPSAWDVLNGGRMQFLPDSVSSLFMDNPVANLVSSASSAIAGVGSPLASGTPSVAASTSLFGGLFGGNEDKGNADVAKKAIEQLADSKARVANAQKLAGLFPDNADPYAPNAVSQEQFEEIVALYTDIERGKTDLKFDIKGDTDEERQALKAAAMGDIAKMMQTESGRAMLESMAHNEKSTDKDRRTTTLELSNGDPSKAHSGVEGMGLRGGYVEEDQQHDRDQMKKLNDGTGFDSRIQYVPGKSFVQEGPDGYAIEHTSDTTLFHEMAHAYHQTRGTIAGRTRQDQYGQWQEEKVGDQAWHPFDRDEDVSEYQASGMGQFEGDFLTENEYRRERREGLGERNMIERERYDTTGAVAAAH
jgi:Effector protein